MAEIALFLAMIVGSLAFSAFVGWRQERSVRRFEERRR